MHTTRTSIWPQTRSLDHHPPSRNRLPEEFKMRARFRFTAASGKSVKTDLTVNPHYAWSRQERKFLHDHLSWVVNPNSQTSPEEEQVFSQVGLNWSQQYSLLQKGAKEGTETQGSK